MFNSYLIRLIRTETEAGKNDNLKTDGGLFVELFLGCTSYFMELIVLFYTLVLNKQDVT